MSKRKRVKLPGKRAFCCQDYGWEMKRKPMPEIPAEAMVNENRLDPRCFWALPEVGGAWFDCRNKTGRGRFAFAAYMAAVCDGLSDALHAEWKRELDPLKRNSLAFEGYCYFWKLAQDWREWGGIA